MRACARLAWGPSDRAASGNDVKSPTNDQSQSTDVWEESWNLCVFQCLFQCKDEEHDGELK